MARRAPGELEAEVLTALWAADAPLTAAEVQAALGGDLAATTIITILNRLVDKQMVRRTRASDERANRYTAARERAEHAAERMHDFLTTDADPNAVLSRFVGRLSARDRRTVLNLLRERKQ